MPPPPLERQRRSRRCSTFSTPPGTLSARHRPPPCFLDTFGAAWTHLVLLGHTWDFLDTLGTSWIHLILLGHTWCRPPLERQRRSRRCSTFSTLQGTLSARHAPPQLPPSCGLLEISVLRGHTWCFLDTLGASWTHLVLLEHTVIHTISLSLSLSHTHTNTHAFAATGRSTMCFTNSLLSGRLRGQN